MVVVGVEGCLSSIRKVQLVMLKLCMCGGKC